jgi:flagellar basal body-associated protein FliL
VAHKARKKKRGWLRVVLLFVFVPFFIWALAFVVWLNWNSISNVLHSDTKSSALKPSKQLDKPARQTEKSPKEKIADEDRKKLEEILKQHKP